MKRWIKFFLMIYLILPFSCEIDDDESECQFSTGRVKIKELSIDYAYNIGYSYYRQTESVTDSLIDQDTLAIAVKVSEIEPLISQLKKKKSTSYPSVYSAYACPPSTIIGRSLIQTISISSNDTLHAQNKTFLPGTSLNHLFRIEYYNDRLEIDDFLQRQQNVYHYSEWRGTFGVGDEILPFVLNDTIKPSKDVFFSFKINVDGDKNFILKTNLVSII